MIPNFSKKNPNDPQDMWLKTWRCIFDLGMIVTSDGYEEPKLPIGRTPTHEEDAACDQWVRKVQSQDTIGRNDIPSPDLAAWLWARILSAQTYIYEQMEKEAPGPTYDSPAAAMEDLLVKRWPDEMVKRWADFSYENDSVRFRGHQMLHRPGRNHGSADTAADSQSEEDLTVISWKNLHRYADILATAMCRKVEMKLPFGQLPPPEVDRRCDKWFRQFFTSHDPQWMVEKNMPRGIAPWLAARVVTASAVAYGNMQTNPNAPTAKYITELMEHLVIEQWNSTLKNMWPGFSFEGGRFEFKGDGGFQQLQSKGIFFSGN